jgi:hypothetical protein
MKWQIRMRRVLLWGGAAVTVLLAVVWIGSAWWTFWWDMPHGGVFIIEAGRCVMRTPTGVGTRIMRPVLWRNSASMEWWFRWALTGNSRCASIPFWAPLTLSAAITAFAWRKEAIARRRARQHACPSCGYDRRGLSSDTVCPECSASFATQS